MLGSVRSRSAARTSTERRKKGVPALTRWASALTKCLAFRKRGAASPTALRVRYGSEVTRKARTREGERMEPVGRLQRGRYQETEAAMKPMALRDFWLELSIWPLRLTRPAGATASRNRRLPVCVAISHKETATDGSSPRSRPVYSPDPPLFSQQLLLHQLGSVLAQLLAS